MVENLGDSKDAASSRAPTSACQDSARVMRDHPVAEFRYKPRSAQPVNLGLRNSLAEHEKPPCCPVPGWVMLATLPQEMGPTDKRPPQPPLRSSFPDCPPSFLCAGPLDCPFINLLSDWLSSRPVIQHLVNREAPFSNGFWSTSCLLTSVSLPSCFRPVLTSVLQRVPVPSSSLQLPALRRPELQLPDLLQEGKSPGSCQEQRGCFTPQRPGDGNGRWKYVVLGFRIGQLCELS